MAAMDLDLDHQLLEKMTAMENRALMWQADLDQELQRLNTEISQVTSEPSPPADPEQLALWRKELRQTRHFLVETLKLLTEDAETLGESNKPKDVSRALARREMELQKREEALQAKEKNWQILKEPSSPLSSVTPALLAKERELLEFKDKQLLQREEALQREKQLQQDREHSFHAREKLLLDRELTLQEEKKLHQERERQLQEREESLQAQRKLQQEREESLDAKERQLRSAPQSLPLAALPAPVLPTPDAYAKAPRRAPKRKAAAPCAARAAPPAEPPAEAAAEGPPPPTRSSRSRERVEDKRPKTKRRRVPYVTFEELHWDWLKNRSPEVPRQTSVEELDLLQALKAPQASIPCGEPLPWDTDLMVELDEVAPPPEELPWGAELMVELEEAPPEFRDESPPAKSVPQAPPEFAPAKSALQPQEAELEESYLVDGLTEEDLFDVEEEAAAEYMPPSPKMKDSAKGVPLEPRAESSGGNPPFPPGSGAATETAAAQTAGAKNKKKDWYQRHYPGQVAPREQRIERSERSARSETTGPTALGRPWQRPRHGYKPAARAANRPPELDWAYEPLKGQPSKTNDGLFSHFSDGLPSIDDVLPSL